jgi:hypothetical protein
MDRIGFREVDNAFCFFSGKRRTLVDKRTTLDFNTQFNDIADIEKKNIATQLTFH